MLIDEATIRVKAGNGGRGSKSFKRNAQTARGGPDGGNGGNGGSVYMQGVDDSTGLAEFRYKKSIQAEDGIKGGKQNLYGRNGHDSYIFLPLGTKVTDLKTKESFEVLDTTTKILVANGGNGGRGNNEFKSATNQAPTYAESGEPGEEKNLLLELKLIADIGLIGLPNSGKSSLLSALTNAHPKIGDYPFTTLEPNLGVLGKKIIADIPGLIEGASSGKGLGIKFLKHIERTKVIVHTISSESENPVGDYKIVRNELSEFNKNLLNEKEIVLITKSDLINEEKMEKIKKEFKKIKLNVLFVSIYDDTSLSSLEKILLT